MTDRDDRKRAAAELAVTWVESGMVVGLGTGSTAIWAIRAIGARVADGRLRGVVGVPTSSASAAAARSLAIPLTTLDDHPAIDLTIDGADEVDPVLNLVKGGGGALLHEKVVAQASAREVIVVDDTKRSPRLGTLRSLPVEVLRFGWGPEAAWLADRGGAPALRRTPDGEAFVTDEGNHILDCAFGPIDDLEGLAGRLDRRAGVVAHGLFLGLTTDLVVAGAGGVEHTTAP